MDRSMKCRGSEKVCKYFRADCYFRGCSHKEAWSKEDRKGKTSVRSMKYYEDPKYEVDNPPEWCPLLKKEN